jgi:hypothetical protein
MVEEHIRGKDAVASIVEGLRGEKEYALPVLSKGNVSRVEIEELKRAAKIMHRTLGQRHYSHSTFIVAPKGIYYLGHQESQDIDSTPEAHLHTSLATGWRLDA